MPEELVDSRKGGRKFPNWEFSNSTSRASSPTLPVYAKANAGVVVMVVVKERLGVLFLRSMVGVAGWKAGVGGGFLTNFVQK